MAYTFNSVLYIDDDKFSTTLLEFFFTDSGFSLTTVNNAQSFFEALDASQIDVILMDARLADTSGLELSQALFARGNPTPIIFLSGGRINDVFDEAPPKNIVGFIEKPFAPETLIDRIQEFLDSPASFATPSQSPDDGLHALKRSYLKHLQEKAGYFSTMLTEPDKLDQDEIKGLVKEIHKTAGTSGLYGFATLSLAAKTLEDLLIALINDEAVEKATLLSCASAFLTSLEQLVEDM